MLLCWWDVQNHIQYQEMQCNNKTAPAEGSVWHTSTWGVTVCFVRGSWKLNCLWRGSSVQCCCFCGLILVMHSLCACHHSHHFFLLSIKFIPSKFCFVSHHAVLSGLICLISWKLAMTSVLHLLSFTCCVQAIWYKQSARNIWRGNCCRNAATALLQSIWFYHGYSFTAWKAAQGVCSFLCIRKQLKI